MSTLETRVREFLSGLGTTADEVAESLRRMGATGPPEDGCGCPVAAALRLEFPEAREENGAVWDEAVGGWFVARGQVRTPFGRFTPPEAVQDFISHFDGYPHDTRYQDLKEEQ